MNRLIFTLLLDGVQRAGSYDPEQALPYFEEHLTLSESRQVQNFLGWVHKYGKKFGRGNLQKVCDEWKISGEVRHFS